MKANYRWGGKGMPHNNLGSLRMLMVVLATIHVADEKVSNNLIIYVCSWGEVPV